MAKIMIIDDNEATSAFLKLSLMRRRHKAIRCVDIDNAMNPTSDFVPDLVLINQAVNNYCGWHEFCLLKKVAPDLPALVYALEQLTVANVDWIIRAVETVINEIEGDKEKTVNTSALATPFQNGYDLAKGIGRLTRWACDNGH
jgi:DNA-binding NtrC family response regulator